MSHVRKESSINKRKTFTDSHQTTKSQQASGHVLNQLSESLPLVYLTCAHCSNAFIKRSGTSCPTGAPPSRTAPASLQLSTLSPVTRSVDGRVRLLDLITTSFLLVPVVTLLTLPLGRRITRVTLRPIPLTMLSLLFRCCLSYSYKWNGSSRFFFSITLHEVTCWHCFLLYAFVLQYIP
jgi:hypothetical protein